MEVMTKSGPLSLNGATGWMQTTHDVCLSRYRRSVDRWTQAFGGECARCSSAVSPLNSPVFRDAPQALMRAIYISSYNIKKSTHILSKAESQTET